MTATLHPIVCEIASAAVVPDEILVLPWGNVASSKGDFIVDQAGADSMVAAFKSHGVDLPIDCEHSTVGGKYASPNGMAPAVGWVRSIEPRPGQGVFSRVLWTSEGADLVARRAYRYVSPVVMVESGSNRAVELHSVALTNKPAIVGMLAIANSAGRSAVYQADGAAQRKAIIAKESSRFDSGGSSLHALTSRRAFVNGALRQAGLPLLADAELDALTDTPERAAAIADAAKKYDGEPGLKVLTARSTFIDGELRHRGMVPLTDAERARHS